MAFINDIRNKITQAGQSTVQKGKDLSEVSRLNNIISTTENQINELYAKIGYEIYRTYADSPLPVVADLIGQVKDLSQNIENCKMQINTINAAILCPQCGAKINKKMVYCYTCGYNLLMKTAPQVLKQEEYFCTNCGAEILPSCKYCTSCGQKIVRKNIDENIIQNGTEILPQQDTKLTNEVTNRLEETNG